MLTFSPVLSGLESLNSHRSTLESFGKKVDEKAKSLRSAELLFAIKKADWDAVSELAEELLANSEKIIVLTEGLCATLFRAVMSTCAAPLELGRQTVQIVSSSLHPDNLRALADSIVGRKVSILLAFHNAPSERLVWCFRLLISALSQGRHADEVKRRVVVTTGEAASDWERWAQASDYRTVSFPHRCAGRYLFFSEPTALLLSLLGLAAWSYVEGGRSFFRQYDKLTETDDPILAYSALREVQLAEHYRETLVLPDETYGGFGAWWRLMTEDSRKLFAEEANDGLVWTGPVMQETASSGRLHWVTEISIESTPDLSLGAEPDDNIPPSSCADLPAWSELDTLYRRQISLQRSGPGYAQPTVRIGLRRRDPFCIGGLFCFFECVVSAGHRLAETSDAFNLCKPHNVAGGVEA
jgi:hypothetical protein